MTHKKEIKLIEYKRTEKAGLYSIRFTEKAESEFEEFMGKFHNTNDEYIKQDYNAILDIIGKIAQKGVFERYFRPEGKFSDNVCALPIDIIPRNKKKYGTLRLYCLRWSDELLILGNGGIKTTQTYEDDDELNGYVVDLQKLDKTLHRLIVNDELAIDGKNILIEDGLTIKL